MDREHGPGEGTIDELPSGRFRLRMRRGDGVRRTRTFETYEEADRIRNAGLKVLADAAMAPIGAVTLNLFKTKFFEKRETDGYRGLRTDRSTWRQHIEVAPFYDLPLPAITERMVRDWATALGSKHARGPGKWTKASKESAPPTDRRISRTTQQHALNLLRVTLESAVVANLITTNVAKVVKLPRAPREARTDEPWTFLSQPEIEQILSSTALSDDERDGMDFTIHGGMRPGEQFALRRGDVRLDGKHPEVTIRHSWSGPTKSGKPRMVPLLPAAAVALQRYLARHPRKPDELIFQTSTGLQHQRGYDFGWADRNGARGEIVVGIKSRVGIARAVRFYDVCRHTPASHLVMGTWGGTAWSLYDVSHFLGHSDIDVTQRYAHLSPEHLHNRAAQTVAAATPAPSRTKAPPAKSFRDPRARRAWVTSRTSKIPQPRETTRERVTGIEPATFSLGS